MKQNKIIQKLSFFAIVLFLLNLLITPAHAQATSIPFKNINQILDDVDNYDGVRLVVFFAHNCHVCKDEIDTLKQIDNNYNVSIIMLNFYQASDNETIVDFIDETNAPLSWIWGYMSDQAQEDFNVDKVPIIIILDDLGRIVADILGASSYKFLESNVVNAIGQNTDEYFTDRQEDPGGYSEVIFIVVGVLISAVVIYFLIVSRPVKKE